MEFKQKVSKEQFFNKYALHGESKKQEVFKGVSTEIASPEKDLSYWVNVFFNLMDTRKFIPGGRILANARVHSLMKNYNNCFVINVEDSMEGIYDALKEDALIGKMGGGVGFNISKLRPRHAPISKGGDSSGPMSFLKVFNESAEVIHTGGGRRGAHICIMNIDHPDVEEFITYKKGDDNEELKNFNISVGITNDFMKAVENDDDWDLKFNNKVYKKVKAQYLYDLIMKNMFDYSEPGILFLDEVAKNNNGYYMYNIDATNPCGEEPLPPYSSCCLGAMNLTSFVKNPFIDKAYFDFDDFSVSVSHSIRFLDNVLETSDYPLEKIREQVLGERRVGLGITGLGDTTAMMKIPYNSEEGKKLIEEIAKSLRDNSYKASVELAKEKGVFPFYDKKILESGFIKKLPESIQKDIEQYGLRNIALNTCAPTGTTSITVGENCSSGVEPIFATQYQRKIRQQDAEDITETVYDYAWLEYINFLGEEPKEKPDFFTTTFDMSPYEAIETQSIFQKYIDASISKTVNLPSNFSFEEYKDLFNYAWKHKLKGYTTFNPDGKLKGIMSIGSKGKQSLISSQNAEKRPRTLPCDIYEMQVDKKRVIALVGILNDKPYEVFITDDPDEMISVKHAKQGVIEKVKSGRYDLIIEGKRGRYILEDISSVFDDEWGTLSRMVSMSLRHNNPLQFIVDQLNKTKKFGTFSKGMARTLKKYIVEGEQVLNSNGVCPECGEKLVFKEGCTQCPSCLFTKCD